MSWIAVPLGILKEYHKTLFRPALPIMKQKTLQEMTFGLVCKVFLEFETDLPKVMTFKIKTYFKCRHRFYNCQGNNSFNFVSKRIFQEGSAYCGQNLSSLMHGRDMTIQTNHQFLIDKTGISNYSYFTKLSAGQPCFKVLFPPV